MTKKQKKVANFLERLVGERVTMEELNKGLSEIFKENIQVENVSQMGIDNGDNDQLPDFDLMFNSTKKKTYGYYDIYMLPTREEGVMYITEVAYEFD